MFLISVKSISSLFDSRISCCVGECATWIFHLFPGTMPSPGNQQGPFPSNQDPLMMSPHSQNLSPNSQLNPGTSTSSGHSPQGALSSPPFSTGMTSPLGGQRSQPGFPLTSLAGNMPSQNFTEAQMFGSGITPDR